MNRNNDFIYDAVSKLESLTQTHIEIDSKRKEYDATLTIKEERLNIIAKSAIRDSNIGMVLTPFVNKTNNEKATILLVAKYISKSSAYLLKDNNLNYLDASGNAFIKKDGIFIFIEGQKGDKYDKDHSRAFQEAGLKLMLLLLSKPESLECSYRELSEKTDISIGSVSNIFTELEDLNFILRTKQKRTIKNKKDLIERWVIAYNDVLKPRILRKRMKFSEYVDFKTVKNLADKDNVVWGGESAVSTLVNDFYPENFMLYSNEEVGTLSQKFGLSADPNGNVEIREFFWKFNNETISAPPLVVYADLISSGFERNIEIAKIIFENELLPNNKESK
ncbi:type IV toxin-antitoxin system AbiEi family antitoxin [Chryseobacterium herbae]|uniref:Type IV toxin-antitoxin system AbiEi family antitoxin n=1 Tax=Chryseobacterium herbae TaxID=2976476 RepID=A0ABT2ISQ5_9FLAO|nr:type IV toxin-antitoxin system AbiEi family antitoxin [Chryseobacterium sp. pc1-10]MCT2561862.1 type IV toxin-antitoxin system AbiEi family antitoxin [Chryseobacterium sp. pc1-10]